MEEPKLRDLHLVKTSPVLSGVECKSRAPLGHPDRHAKQSLPDASSPPDRDRQARPHRGADSSRMFRTSCSCARERIRSSASWSARVIISVTHWRTRVAVSGFHSRSFVFSVSSSASIVTDLFIIVRRGELLRNQTSGPLGYRCRRDILLHLKQESQAYCTTMLDFYGLGDDFPGLPVPPGLSGAGKSAHIESAIHADFRTKFPDLRPDRRLIPYIQPHEYEACCSAIPISSRRQLIAPNSLRDFNRSATILKHPKTSITIRNPRRPSGCSLCIRPIERLSTEPAPHRPSARTGYWRSVPISGSG